MGSGPSLSHAGDVDDTAPASTFPTSASVGTAARLGTDSSQEFEPHGNGSATPSTSAKRILSYCTLRKPSVPRIDSMLSAESDITSSPRSNSTKSRTRMHPNPSPNSKKRCVTRAMVNGKKDVDYDMKHHPMDELLRPNAAARRSAEPMSRSPSPLPNKRCVTGVMVNSKNDMKHHPMDDLLCPKAVKTRPVQARASSPSAVSAPISPFLRRENSPWHNDLENPFTRPVFGEWEDLEPLDRRIYKIQRGAPSKGNTLPHKWTKVVSILVNEEYFTREHLNKWGGIQALEGRYERVRVHMMNLFGAPEEPMDEEDLVLRYSEGFDVYDLQPRATKRGSAKPNSVDRRETGGISHSIEGLADEEVTAECEGNHYANDENPESAEPVAIESDIDGIEINNLHRHELYGLIQDYVNDGHDGQPVCQSQAGDIRLNDQVSLPASPIGQNKHGADKQRSSSVLTEHTDQKTDLESGLSDHEVSGYETNRTATRRTKQKEFEVYEDSAEPSSAGRCTTAVRPISNDLDPPKENFHERGEIDVEAAAENLFRDLSNATQRHHRTLSTPSDTSFFSANENLPVPVS